MSSIQSSPAGEEVGLRRSGATNKELVGIALLGMAFTTIWAIALGKDIDWVQRNYHYYAVYAWLTDRVTYHIAPGQLQSWLNPLIYVPHYMLIHYTAPVVAGAVFGALAGLAFLLVYALTRMLLPAGPLWRAVLPCFAGP